MAIVAYALTTLDHLKEVLGETTNDNNTLLENIINRATDTIESYCNNRRFKSTVYTEEMYDGTGTHYINLRQYPVTEVTVVEQNNGIAGDPHWDVVDSDLGSYIEDGHGPGQLYYEHVFVRGARNYRTTYTAGYTTIPYDLEQACLDLCVWFYKQRQTLVMKSETLGEYSYTKETLTGNPIENLGLDLILEKYRTPVI
jgi:hypothetical protein